METIEHASSLLRLTFFFSVFMAVPVSLYVKRRFLSRKKGGIHLDSAKVFRVLIGPYLLLEVIGWVLYLQARNRARLRRILTILLHAFAFCAAEAISAQQRTPLTGVVDHNFFGLLFY